MWSDRKPWWSRKAKDNNPAENSHYKNWCVIKVHTGHRNNLNTWGYEAVYQYKAIGRSNAPMYYDEHNKLQKRIEVDNLTKHEAHCVARGLNFLDKE